MEFRQFRSFDLMVFTFCSTITLGIIFLPFISSLEIRNVGMQLATSSLPYFILLWLIKSFCKYYTDHDFFGALKTHLWSGLYWLVLLYFLLSTYLSGLTLNNSLDMIVSTYLLENTPSWIIIITYLGVVGFAVTFGIVGITRFIVLLAFLEMFILIVVCAMAFTGNFTWIYIPPLWDITFMDYLKSSVSYISRYGGTVALLAFIVYVKKDEPMWKSMNMGLAFVAVFYIAISLVVIGTFGYDQSMALLSPVVSLVQSITTRTGLVERLDLLFLSFWMMAFYKIKLIQIWFTLYIVQKCWPKFKAPLWVFIYITLSFVGYLFAPNLIYSPITLYNYNMLISSLLLPALLLVYLIWKKKKVSAS